MTSNKTFIVAKNEFLKRVKTRWFIITTLLGPLILIGFITVVGFLSISAVQEGQEEEKIVLVLDHTGRLGAELEDGLTFLREATVTGNDLPLVIDQNGIGETKSPYTFDQLLNLLLTMRSRITPSRPVAAVS